MPEEVPLSDAGRGPRRPVVGLLTDFGRSEPFVGLMKARILDACPDAALVDLTHELPPYGVEAAAFWIDRALAYFPGGTVHVCVVDPGVGTDRRILLVEACGQLFLAPDNGLLARVAGREAAIARAVSQAVLGAMGLGAPSATFHGRDLFAPLAGRLAAGTVHPAALGAPIDDWLRVEGGDPGLRDTTLHGRILFQDHFGNLFSNVEIKSPFKTEEWTVHAAGRSFPWVRTYGDAPPGTLVALENSFGVVELSCVGDSAARRLGIEAGAPVELRRRAAPPGRAY